MNTMPWLVRIYLALIVLIAVSVTTGLLINQGLPATDQLLLAAILSVCMLLAWLYPLPVGFKTHFYLDTAVIIAAVLHFEPGAAMLICGGGTFAAQGLRRRLWDEALFNTGQTMLQAAVAALLMTVAGYQPGVIQVSTPGFVVATVATGIALFLTSAVLVGMIVSLQGGLNPLGVWAESILKADDAVYLGHVAQIGLGIVITVLGDAHPWTIILLIPPVAVVYLALDHGLELRRQIGLAFRLQEKNLTEAQRLAQVGSWEWDLSSGAQGWSEEAFRMLGFEPPFPTPQLERLLERVHPDDRDEVDRKIHAAIRFESRFDTEHRVLRPDGTERMIHHRGEIIRDDVGDRLRVVAMLHDISERKTLEAKLEHMAYHDSLTGLANRTLLLKELTSTLEEARRGGPEFALMFIDLDDFKQINDTLGHKTGDEFLIEVSRRLKDGLRQDDIVARYASDEFIVLARSVNRVAEAERLATRLLQSLDEPVILGNGQMVEATASIGIVMPDNRLNSTGDLLQRVDSALYHAKRQGKNSFVTYEAGLEPDNALPLHSK